MVRCRGCPSFGSSTALYASLRVRVSVSRVRVMTTGRVSGVTGRLTRAARRTSLEIGD